MSGEIWYCETCGEKLNFEPKYCCDGRECGCMGLPIDPPFCSEVCYDKYIEKIEQERKQ